MSEQEQTIDLRVLLKVLLEHLIPIIAVTLAAAAIGFSLAKFVIPKKYTSEALMYVENSSAKQDDASINVNDITAAQKLVNTCQILFTSDSVFGKLSDHFGGAYSKSELNGMVSISSVNSTEVLKISVVSKSPQESYDIASELIVLATEEFQRIIKGGSIETVSSPTLPQSHTYPSTMRFTLIAALIGLVGTYFIFLIIELLDTKVKPEDDLTSLYDLPVFAEILDFESAGRSGYKYGKYGRYSRYGKYGYGRYGGYENAGADQDEKDDKNEDKNDSESVNEEKESEGVKKRNGKEK